MLSLYSPIFPELFIAISALILILWGAFHNDESGYSLSIIALFVIIGSMLLIFRHPPVSQELFNGAFIDDRFARYMKILTLLGSAFAIILSLDYFRREQLLKFEYPILILLSTLGMLLTISANDLISLYIALEFQSLGLYVIAAFDRDKIRSSEAGLKYFVLGVLSSGLLLYGMSLIYGYTGSTSFSLISASIQLHGAPIGCIFGLVFILTGIAFKVSAVPFHMWTPDVYEGAPTPVTAYFSAAPKIAAVAMLLRVLIGAFPSVSPQWQQIIIAMSIASMALGAFAAIGQQNIKRLLAYSSIGHIGYALIGLASATPDGAGSEGISSTLIYMAIYLAMTIGSFACVLAMRNGDKMLEDVRDLGGVSKEKPFFAFLFAMLLFSLAGIPPLGGFFGKLYVFQAAIQAHLYWYAVVGVVLSVVSAYYYLRIVKIMYFDEKSISLNPLPLSLRITLGASAAFVILFFISPSHLKLAADIAARSLY